MKFLTSDPLITVRFREEGWHHWPGATGTREYLAHDHRHMFHVEASMTVGGDDREVEFHDFMDFCRLKFPGGQMGGKSCESMARDLVGAICGHYQRACTVKVFEDGEVGATVISIRWHGDHAPPGWRLLDQPETKAELAHA